jgi:hypothetical protein
MDDDRIDFSPLDPSRDARRFEALVGAVTERALASRRRAATVSGQLAAWWRPALAAAAVIAIAVWVSSAGPGRSQERKAERAHDANADFMQWALGAPSSSVWEDVARAGGDDDPK